MTSRALLLAVALTASLAPRLTAQDVSIEGLPSDAPQTGTVITVDVSTNQVYLFRDGELVRKSRAATGSDKILRKDRMVWWFRTPRGRHQVVGKIKDPVWTRPDWAYIEEGKKVPSPDHPSRKEPGKMGKYALDLGERVMIHGTNEPQSIGKKATHGCIRVPKDMLTLLWKEVEIGTEVLIFESHPRQVVDNGLSDLEMR